MFDGYADWKLGTSSRSVGASATCRRTLRPDRHVITATGLISVDFILEILNELDISTPEMRSVWYEAFKHGNYPDNVGHDY